jgi:hypothetical protein
VRITRLLIEPGHSVQLQPPCGMLVAIEAGEIVLSGAGGEERLSLQPASFKWRQIAETMELINRGGSTIHVVDVLVK